MEVGQVRRLTFALDADSNGVFLHLSEVGASSDEVSQTYEAEEGADVLLCELFNFAYVVVDESAFE